MAKATEHEKILRVHDVYQKLVASWPTADILDYAEQKWGIGRTATYAYITEARERLKANCDVKEADWIAQKLTTLERMTKDELQAAADAESGTNSRMAALQMIRTQAQLIKVL
jgi:hypothetical protein